MTLFFEVAQSYPHGPKLAQLTVVRSHVKPVTWAVVTAAEDGDGLTGSL